MAKRRADDVDMAPDTSVQCRDPVTPIHRSSTTETPVSLHFLYTRKTAHVHVVAVTTHGILFLHRRKLWGCPFSEDALCSIFEGDTMPKSAKRVAGMPLGSNTNLTADTVTESATESDCCIVAVKIGLVYWHFINMDLMAWHGVVGMAGVDAEFLPSPSLFASAPNMRYVEVDQIAFNASSAVVVCLADAAGTTRTSIMLVDYADERGMGYGCTTRWILETSETAPLVLQDTDTVRTSGTVRVPNTVLSIKSSTNGRVFALLPACILAWDISQHRHIAARTATQVFRAPAANIPAHVVLSPEWMAYQAAVSECQGAHLAQTLSAMRISPTSGSEQPAVVFPGRYPIAPPYVCLEANGGCDMLERLSVYGDTLFVQSQVSMYTKSLADGDRSSAWVQLGDESKQEATIAFLATDLVAPNCTVGVRTSKEFAIGMSMRAKTAYVVISSDTDGVPDLPHDGFLLHPQATHAVLLGNRVYVTDMCRMCVCVGPEEAMQV